MDNRLLDCFHDLLTSIDDIEQFTHHLSFEMYDEDVKTQAATERKFEMIGEALNRIGSIDDALLQKIANHRDLIAFREVLARGREMDSLVVWGFIETQLLPLKADLCTLI